MRQKANRLLLRRRERSARKAEAFVFAYEFPPHVERRVRRKHSGLDDENWALVERGLREWFVCCAWRGRTMLGMPSRVVDEAWHEFILDSVAYVAFCDAVFGAYLHHMPDEAMSTSMGDALGNTVRAWDRSDIGTREESVLWDLDEQLGIPEPLGVNGLQLSATRAGKPSWGWAAAGCGGGPIDGGSGGDGGGDGGGGGCGGGGCGGGGGS